MSFLTEYRPCYDHIITRTLWSMEYKTDSIQRRTLTITENLFSTVMKNSGTLEKKNIEFLLLDIGTTSHSYIVYSFFYHMRCVLISWLLGIIYSTIVYIIIVFE